VRNEKECVCSAPSCCYTEQRSASNILISGKIIKEMPGSVASGTPCILSTYVKYFTAFRNYWEFLLVCDHVILINKMTDTSGVSESCNSLDAVNLTIDCF